MMKRSVFVFIAGMLMWPFCAWSGELPPYPVRVLVEQKVPDVEIRVTAGSFILRAPFTYEEIARVDARELYVTMSDIGISVNTTVYPIFGLVIEARGAQVIEANNKRFPGMLLIIRNKKSLQVAAVLDLEEYLTHVVGREMPYHWPLEALKAQAIVSRTYVLQRMRESMLGDYDVSASTQDQVADLHVKPRQTVTEAVRQTRGVILLYQGDIFSAFFHSTCGGTTKKASLFWNVPDIPPLGGVSCGRCTKSNFFRWEKTFSDEQFIEALKKANISVSSLTDLAVVDGIDGKELLINRKKRVSTYRLRTSLGDYYLKSPDFEISLRNNTVHLSGKGWGHGAGMCQWGALSLAQDRYDAPAIVSYYYPEAEIGVLKEYLN